MIKNMAKAIRWQVLEDSMNQLFLASSSLALEANAPKPSSELHESTELAKTGTIVTVLDSSPWMRRAVVKLPTAQNWRCCLKSQGCKGTCESKGMITQ